MINQSLTHLSLFSGIGGLDLAAEWAGFVTVGQCEWADYPTKILEKHWPDVPRWRDIRTLTKGGFYEYTGLRTVDLISGGFPCQPFSTAGKRRGKEDDRYLWPEMLRVIEEIQPRWVVGENVAGIVSLALDQVLSDLESKGYETRAVIIPACGVDAPHRRDRVAIMGYAKHDGFPAATVCGSIDATSCDKPERPDASGKSAGAGRSSHGGAVADAPGEREWGLSIQQGQPRHPNANIERSCENVAYPDSKGLQRWVSGGVSECTGQWPAGQGGAYVANTTSRKLSQSEPESGQQGKRETAAAERTLLADSMRRSTQPGLGGMADGFSCWLDEPDGVPRIATGIPHRADRLKCLGNAVVPQQFYPIFKAIAEIGGNP